MYLLCPTNALVFAWSKGSLPSLVVCVGSKDSGQGASLMPNVTVEMNKDRPNHSEVCATEPLQSSEHG